MISGESMGIVTSPEVRSPETTSPEVTTTGNEREIIFRAFPRISRVFFLSGTPLDSRYEQCKGFTGNHE